MVVLVLLGLQLSGKTQTANLKTCYNDIRAYAKSSNSMNLPPKGKAYHFIYSTSMFYQNKRISSETVDMSISNTNMTYRTDNSLYLRDEKITILVFYEPKNIIVLRSELDYYKNKDYKLQAQMIDSLLNTLYPVSFIESTNSKNQFIQKLTMKPIDITSYVDKVIMSYNKQLQTVFLTEIYYKKNGKVDKFVQEIKEANYDYEYKDTRPVLQKVFTSKMELKPEYKGFTVINKMDE